MFKYGVIDRNLNMIFKILNHIRNLSRKIEIHLDTSQIHLKFTLVLLPNKLQKMDMVRIRHMI